MSFQDPKLLCVAYSAVGKLSRYNKITLIFFLNIASWVWDFNFNILYFTSFPFSRMPQLFTKDIALVQQFFESMCKVGEEENHQSKFIFVASVEHRDEHSVILIFPNFCFAFFRRTLTSVLPFRKLCL